MIYPDCPKIAELYNVAVIRIINYQTWHNCFFVKIAGIGWRFVSKRLTRKVVKVAVKKKVKTKKLYRVVRLWYQNCWLNGDRMVSVLLQSVSGKYEQFWHKRAFKSQNFQRDQIVELEDGCLIPSNLDYAQAVGLY